MARVLSSVSECLGCRDGRAPRRKTAPKQGKALAESGDEGDTPSPAARPGESAVFRGLGPGGTWATGIRVKTGPGDAAMAGACTREAAVGKRFLEGAGSWLGPSVSRLQSRLGPRVRGDDEEGIGESGPDGRRPPAPSPIPRHSRERGTQQAPTAPRPYGPRRRAPTRTRGSRRPGVPSTPASTRRRCASRTGC